MASAAALVLADSSAWYLAAGNPAAAPIVRWLGRALGLDAGGATGRRLEVVARSAAEPAIRFTPAPTGGVRVEIAEPRDRDCRLGLRRRLLAPVWREAEARGGVLVHGGLVACGRRGVILAGPGRVGKSTACRRMPSPWRSLSDDLALVVRTPDGEYRAHPVPTWSRFLFGGGGGVWPLEKSVALDAILILRQGPQVERRPLAGAVATGVLLELAEQAWRGAERDFGPVAVRAARLDRLASITGLVAAVPCATLELTLAGDFDHLLAPGLDLADAGNVR